jgi:hypothetical protein
MDGGGGTDLVSTESSTAALPEQPKYGMLPELMVDASPYLARDWYFGVPPPHYSIPMCPMSLSRALMLPT